MALCNQYMQYQMTINPLLFYILKYLIKMIPQTVINVFVYPMMQHFKITNWDDVPHGIN